ncbi:MAG TPA: hypothetical protein VE173_06305, partial [Longimicrobiales bacterium]|nr:hypothetical protein [Longimicrobiales bacterium]
MSRRIVVFHPAGLGDAVMDLALLRSVSASHDGPPILWVTSPYGPTVLRAAGLEGAVRPVVTGRGVGSTLGLLPRGCGRADVLAIPGGMNLRRLTPLVRLLRPRRAGGAIPDHPGECVAAVRPRAGVFEVVVGPVEGLHRVALDARLGEALGLTRRTGSPRLRPARERRSGLAVVHHGAAPGDDAKRLPLPAWKPLLEAL